MVGFCCSSRTRARALVLMIQVSLFFASSSPSLAADTLAQGQFIKDDGRTTIVSSQKVFELGFFSPGKSPYRYVGIWYHGIVPQATVWVANRDAPLRGSNGSFGISATGLVVLDGNQTAIWSSSSSSNTSAASNSSAQLMDSGNLVIRSPSGAELWQSFDNPTDTFIPGMRISIDLASRRNHIFKSWRTADDPATGNYSVGLDPNGSFQIYMWEGGAVRWRSGQWDGGTFLGSKMRALFEYGFKLITDGKKNYFTFATNRSLYRFVMQPDGVENTTIFDNETRKWSSFWSQPINECDFYNHCNANSVCSDVAGGGATCECLPGYETRSAEESSGVDRSGGGCSRRMQWQCERNGAGEADGFKLVEGMKLPDFSEFVQTASDDAGCRAICSRNCSCRAYSFVNGYGCFVWGRDLVDMHHFDDGTKAGNLYIKLAGSELDSKKTTWILPLVLALLGAVLLISCLCLWWKYRVLIREWWKSRSKQSTLLVDHSGMDIRMDFISRDFSTKSDVAEKGTISELSIYQFEAIVTATDNFSPSNKLGQGGFGEVFKGRLPWGEEIAVKRLSKGSGQGLEEFKNEALLIAKLQHRNLVRLLGCCVEKDEKILVYEYLQNKSLDAFLFDPEKNVELDWKKRLNIIEGIARGLLYLHRDSRLKIVHRDLKASNILLDEEMNPKISDFGMARIFEYNQNQDNTNRVVGTFGYMSPEYAMEGLFSVKSDIYSFGVLLLEIISGRKNSSFYRSEGAKNLVGHAWKLWNEDKAMELVDPSIKSSTSSHEVLKYIHLGLLCVQDRAIDRPIIEHLVNMLGNETTVLVMPKQPTYTLEGIPGETDSIQTDKEYFTSNDVTVTSLSVR